MPLAYRWLRALGVRDLRPWQLVEPAARDGSRRAFRVESGGRDVVPFAARRDNDDTAGFEVLNGQTTGRVVVFHPAWSGREEPGLIDAEYEDLWAFLARRVVEDMRDWANEVDLADMVARRGEPPAA